MTLTIASLVCSLGRNHKTYNFLLKRRWAVKPHTKIHLTESRPAGKPRDKLKRSKNIVTSHHRLRSSFAVELFGILIWVIMYRISRVHLRNGRKNWESSWGAYSNISGKFEYLQRLCAINLHRISLVQICLRRCHGDLGISVFWVSLLILH